MTEFYEGEKVFRQAVVLSVWCITASLSLAPMLQSRRLLVPLDRESLQSIPKLHDG
jgi:hypothetical protein